MVLELTGLQTDPFLTRLLWSSNIRRVVLGRADPHILEWKNLDQAQFFSFSPREAGPKKKKAPSKTQTDAESHS